jgi:hypothetical protein
MFKLKDYQNKALTALDSFFRQLCMNVIVATWKSSAPQQDDQRRGVLQQIEDAVLREPLCRQARDMGYCY